MALLTWSDKLSVGVRKFDEEHKQLVRLVNQLHEAMKSGQGKQVMSGILQSLVSYTRNHFAAEERLLQAHNYPDYAQHKKEHNLLTLSVLDLQKQYQEGTIFLSQKVMDFLKDWLASHIQGQDMAYGPFLKDKGV